MSDDESDEGMMPLLNDAKQGVVKVEAELSDVSELTAVLNTDNSGSQRHRGMFYSRLFFEIQLGSQCDGRNVQAAINSALI